MTHRARTILGGVLILALAAAWPLTTVLTGSQQPAATPRVRALVIASGAFHDYLHQSRVLVESVGKAVPVDWTIALQGSPNGTRTRYPVYDRDDWASGYDVVIHNECSADISDPDFIRRITGAHRSARVPAMVIHCSMHSYRAAQVDDWREFLGVTSLRHTPQFRIPVTWDASGSPVTAGMAPGWITPLDELYVVEKFWPGSKALASAVDPRTQQAHAVAWTNDYHGVRVFGTTLGHGNATWDDPVYQDLLVRGFKWAVGR